MNKELQNLLEKQEFTKKLLHLQTKEEVKDYFNSFDYKITDDEIEELRTFFSKLYEEVNKLSNEKKKQLANMTEEEKKLFISESKKALKELSTEQLDKTVGGANGITKEVIIGGAIGSLAGIAGTIACKDEIGAAVKKIYNKFILVPSSNIKFAIADTITGMPLRGALAVSAATVTVGLVAGPTLVSGAAGAGLGYLTKKK